MAVFVPARQMPAGPLVWVVVRTFTKCPPRGRPLAVGTLPGWMRPPAVVHSSRLYSGVSGPQLILRPGILPVHYWAFSTVPGLCPLEARCTSHPAVTPSVSAGFVKCPPVETHWRAV